MINKNKCIALLTAIILLSTLSLANNKITTVNDGGETIVIVGKSSNTGHDRSSSIAASINEHYLTINFLTDIGHVWIKVTDVSGVTLDLEYSETPTGYVYYIPSAGHYVLVITLWDGDVYEGEFDVTV